MAITYFGQCDSSGNPAGDADDAKANDATQLGWYNAKTFTCPGSGTQVVKDLSAYVKANSGSPLIRVGIYSTAGVLIACGAAQVSVSSASYAWVGHQSQASISPNPVTLTGGTSYKLAIYMDYAGECGIRYQTGGSDGDVAYDLSDFSAGLPDPLPADDLVWSGWWVMRCGVEPESAPPSIVNPYFYTHLMTGGQ